MLRCIPEEQNHFPFAEDEKRLFRIQSMLKVEGTLVLRKSLDNQLGANALATVLNQSSTRIKIENALKRKVIKKNQFALLYPAVGSVQVDTLDITLLTFLMRELHLTLNSKSPIWTNPNPNDLSVEAESTRLRNMRNHFAHEGRNQLSEKDFNDTFFELRDLICRVSESCGFMESKAMSDCLDKKKVGPLDVKPALSDRSTSITSSLERNIANFGEKISIEKPELHVKSNHYRVLKCTSNLQSLPHGRRNSSSSTACARRKKKKKIPQNTTIEFELSTNKTHKRSAAKHKPRIDQNLFCACFLAKSRFREHSNVKTTHNSDLNSDRCQIEGIGCDMHNNLFIAVKNYELLQMLEMSRFKPRNRLNIQKLS